MAPLHSDPEWTAYPHDPNHHPRGYRDPRSNAEMPEADDSGAAARRDRAEFDRHSIHNNIQMQEVTVASIAQEFSLFEIDRELDDLLDHIEEEIETLGEASPELIDRFQAFCEAHGEKADCVGRFIRLMEARVQYCRNEASRLQDRARICDRRVTQTKHMVLYYLKSRDLKKIEGREFTLRIQRTAKILFDSPMRLRSRCDSES